MAMMNYNEWFNEQHRYLQGTRNGVPSYNDTKWAIIAERYRSLMDLNSELLDTQPFGVVGNYTGFQKLTELMEKSNYTFEDLDRSLIETYRMSLKNAMSGMLVNTHAVVAKYSNLDTKHVSHDKYGHYYIIDVPFVQLHFGDRDEFIRKKLHEFHETENDYYMPSDKFLSDEISKLLGFTFICCANGFMSEDWAVAIDDKGFRFKIGWKYASDVEFIIYKLDSSRVIDCVVSTRDVSVYHRISLVGLGVPNETELIGSNCIVQISDEVIRKDIQIPPNFGRITNRGLEILNLQSKTYDDLERYNSNHVRVRVYVLKYLHEVPGVYPALNYYDMMGSRYVFDDQGNHVTNDDGYRIHGQETVSNDTIEVCTPPISLDHNNTASFYSLIDCCRISDRLTGVIADVKHVWDMAMHDRSYFTDIVWDQDVRLPLTRLLNVMTDCYQDYMQAAIVTSMIPMKLVTRFAEVVERFQKLRGAVSDYDRFQSMIFDEMQEDNFKQFIKQINKPIENEPFTTFHSITTDVQNYFPLDPENRINRPISEQCFITLRHNRDESCWVFDVPNIEHFKGIGNTFYINQDLNGDEIYKFFFLYTDTLDPAEKTTEPLKYHQLIDFDEFTQEVDRHMGYVKYWGIESRLMKLSHILYQRHDVDTSINVLSKMLKQKLDGDIFLEYPSDINYEISNVTTDNLGAGEFDIRAPFALNFLFYTVSMLYDNKDQLQSYFLHMLSRKPFHPRYADLELSRVIPNLEEELINYSVVTKAPSMITANDWNASVPGDAAVATLYNGIPFPIMDQKSGDPNTSYLMRWGYTFNQYDISDRHYMMTQSGLDRRHYIRFTNSLAVHGCETFTFHDDARIANIVTHYLAELYEGINQLQTNYKTEWNQQTTVNSIVRMIEKYCGKINDYVSDRAGDIQFHHPNITNVLAQFNSDGGMVAVFQSIGIMMEKCHVDRGGNFDIYTVTNKILSGLQKTYDTVGFDMYTIRHVRKLYIHLKKINERMSLYQYQKWLSDIDMDTLANLDNILSDNIRNETIPFKFLRYANAMNNYCPSLLSRAKQLALDLASLNGWIYDTHIRPLVEYCKDVVENYIFDLYTIDKIVFSGTFNYDTLPAYAELVIPTKLPHVQMPHTPAPDGITNYSILLHVRSERNAGVHGTSRIVEMMPVCEYAFFSGDTIEPATVRFYTDRMVWYGDTNIAGSITVHFKKVSSSADVLQTFSRYIGIQSIPLEVQNNHETFDVLKDGTIVNEKHASLHYELLCANRFTPLTHKSEYVRHDSTETLSGPIDKLYLSCDRLNKLSITDRSYEPARTMFFKPCQVFHLDVDEDGVMTSVGGKYFEGQTVYAVTDDGLSVFPVIITAVDHSEAHGFVEAKVDEYHAHWFRTSDMDTITKYLTTDIECTVVDDNIRNFMDEFSEYEGDFYPIPHLGSTAYRNNENDDVYTLPGDPIYVQNNSDYVYTRLNWLFHDELPNRTSDHINPLHHFVYIGSGTLNTSDNEIVVNMLNHDFNPLTNPELYPTLRTEPDDHSIWKKEVEKFKQEIVQAHQTAAKIQQDINDLTTGYRLAKTRYERRQWELSLTNAKLKMEYQNRYVERLEYYLAQLEVPTTWYNVRSYDDALVYINNGRAHITHTFMPNRRDISYTEDIQVRLYDWEHKMWINPDAYVIEPEICDGPAIDAYDDYGTNDVMTTLTISFRDKEFSSKRILIYFVYNQSDVFDKIELHDMKCRVRFKPILSLKKPEDEPQNIYDGIRIRKHYDESEIYHVQRLEPVPDGFPYQNGFMFERPDRSGLYTYGSPIRFCDMQVTSGSDVYTYRDFDIYIRNPMTDTTVDQQHTEINYDANVIRAIDGFEPDKHVTLICIQNNASSSFDGVSSSVMFEALTSETNGQQTLTVVESTLSHSVTGSFICTVIPDPTHPISGGVIEVNVSSGQDSTTVEQTPIKDWFHLVDDQTTNSLAVAYKIIPKQVILVPKESTSIVLEDTTVKLRNLYVLDSDHDVTVHNEQINDRFTYYYDKNRDVRFPIADVRKNSYQKRLTIDRSENPSTQSIRANHIGVCRYAVQHFPQDGFIDLTGYIPTPLSRDRYEFWVNGRYVTDDNIIILSPTSFQLRNMKSLRNLEVIELVDDVYDSEIMPRGTVYIDINGHVYGSYQSAILHNANIMEQSIRYRFNQHLRSGLDDYIPPDLRASNNIDCEPDILTYLKFKQDPDEIIRYDELYNLPSINGCTIYHATSKSMGFMELTNFKVLQQLDETWKRERLNGILPITHRTGLKLMDEKSQFLHVMKTDEGFEIYTTGVVDHCFTLYISTMQDGNIDNKSFTIKIMPMLRSGIHVILDESYQDMWLHSTVPNTTPVKIR